MNAQMWRVILGWLILGAVGYDLLWKQAQRRGDTWSIADHILLAGMAVVVGPIIFITGAWSWFEEL